MAPATGPSSPEAFLDAPARAVVFGGFCGPDVALISSWLVHVEYCHLGQNPAQACSSQDSLTSIPIVTCIRWHNQLNPDVKKDPFSEWEDAVIVMVSKNRGNVSIL